MSFYFCAFFVHWRNCCISFHTLTTDRCANSYVCQVNCNIDWKKSKRFNWIHNGMLQLFLLALPEQSSNMTLTIKLVSCELWIFPIVSSLNHYSQFKNYFQTENSISYHNFIWTLYRLWCIRYSKSDGFVKNFVSLHSNLLAVRMLKSFSKLPNIQQ